LKTLPQSLIARGFVGEKLKSYRLAEREVVGAIDLSHATFSKQGNDAVAASQQAAGKEAAFAEDIRRNWRAEKRLQTRPQAEGRNCRSEVERGNVIRIGGAGSARGAKADAHR